jgi:predicted dehydrogenase
MGFVGPHHLDAMRRLGFVEVTALCASSLGAAKQKAAELHVGKAYGDWRELVNDPEVDVVDVATPTHLHFPIALAAIQAGKHVIVDKPLALNANEARILLDHALQAGVVHAVAFNIRSQPLAQQMRALIGRGKIGPIHFVHGHYLQEWLLYDADFSWRLEAEHSGPAAMVADAGAHWYDLCEHLTGLRVAAVAAELHTILPTRKRPSGAQREAFAAATPGATQDYTVKVPDLGCVLLRFDNGARGTFSTTSLAAGHKNDLRIEVNGATGSVRWEQERSNELWIGRRDQPNEVLLKDPQLLDESVRHYARLPGGHNEGWSDAFRNLMREIFSFIAEKRDFQKGGEASFPTFRDGLRAARIVDAIVESHAAGGQWVAVRNES